MDPYLHNWIDNAIQETLQHPTSSLQHTETRILTLLEVRDAALGCDSSSQEMYQVFMRRKNYQLSINNLKEFVKWVSI